MKKTLGLLSGSLYLGLAGFSYADTILTDADFPYNGSLDGKTQGNISINTSNSKTPVVNAPSGTYALNAYDETTTTLNNAKPLKLISTDSTATLRSVGTFNAYGDVEVDFHSTVRSRGVYAVKSTVANFYKNLTVTSDSNYAIGVNLYSSGQLAMKDANGTLAIHLTGKNAIGIVSQTESPIADQSFVSVSKVVINLTGENTIGIFTDYVSPDGEDGKSTLTFNNDVSIITKHGEALHTQLNNGVFNFNTKSTFISEDFEHYNAILNYKGTINIAGETDIQGDMFLSSANSHTNIGAKMTILGSIDVVDQAELSMNAQSGSLIKGGIHSDSTARTTLSLATGAEWDVSKNSQFQTLNNQGQVRFIDNGGGTFTTLNVDTLSGSGTFVMNADIAGQTGDKIVAATTSGAHLVRVVNNGSLSTTGTEAFDMIETGDGKATFTGTNKVELGGYEYQLARSTTNRNNWRLYGGKVLPKEPPLPEITTTPTEITVTQPEITTPQTETTVTQTNSGKITTTANAAASFASAGYLMSYVDNQMLMTRMGELRNNPNSAQGNFWVRGFGGKMNAFSVGKIAGFDMSYGGTQFGLDKAVDTSKGIFYGGAALSYISGNPDYWGGDANYKTYQASLYATYLADSGYYIDGLLKYKHQKNEFDVRDSAGNKVNGNASSDGWGASVEVGKRIILKDERFYIEPQLQLSYSSLGSYDSHASNGLYIKADDTTSLLGRIGGIVGYKLDQVMSPTHLYANAYYVHEFDGDVDYRLNGSHEGHSFKGDWGDFAVGFNTQILKQHNLYSEVHYETGERFDDTRFNLGYRFQF